MLILIFQPRDVKNAMFLISLGDCKSQKNKIYELLVQSSMLRII
jgi:hypothetical protein